MIIADLHDDNSIQERALHLSSGDARGASLAETSAEIRRHVCSGIVGLYIARKRCGRIEINASQSPSDDRFEIFDDSVWVTLFSDRSSPGSQFPLTLRFTKTSFIHTMQRRDFLRAVKDSRVIQKVINPSTTEIEFLAIFDDLTGIALTKAELAALEAEFHTFREDFVAEAELTGSRVG